MKFRSTSFMLTAIAAVLAVPLFLSGCGGGGGGGAKAIATIDSVVARPTAMAAMDGIVQVTAITTGSVSTIETFIKPDGGTAGLAMQMTATSVNGDVITWAANLSVEPNNTGNDQSCTVTVRGTDTNGNQITPRNAPTKVTVYANTPGKPNMTIWGKAKDAFGNPIAITAPPAIEGVDGALNPATLASSIAYDSTGNYQISFTGNPNTTYRLILTPPNPEVSYWPYRGRVTPTTHVYKNADVVIYSTETPPPIYW